jgi:hypothetical protein
MKNKQAGMRDPDVKGYTSMADLKAALESDD